MVNGLGVLGWGVGGIEAEAAMLGQPVSMLIPQVVGFKLTGELAGGSTATDLVLTVTEMLRKHGVVGKFVEFYGEGVAEVPLANRATLGNMSPEFGSTGSDFPDRPGDHRLPEVHRPQGRACWRWSRPTPRSRVYGTTPSTSRRSPEYLELDLSEVVPSIAGPKRPQDRIVVVGSQVHLPRARSPTTSATTPTRRTTPSSTRRLDETFPGQRPWPTNERPRRRPRRPGAFGRHERQGPGEQPGDG